MRSDVKKSCEELIDFIDKSPVSYHAVENIKHMLADKGFMELAEADGWKLKSGCKYFVTRNDSAIIAFAIPKKFNGINIVASHSDSPCFIVKESPEMDRAGAYTVLNVEKYGGMLIHPWFDRPLSVAGRIFTGKNGKITGKLVDIEKNILMIPSLAIHMDRNANDGHSINAQEELLPLYSVKNKGNDESFMDAVADAAGCGKGEILGSDLFVYCNEKGYIWGPDDEFISAPRLDDLQCAFTTLKGFLSASKYQKLSVYVVFDNEEVGSSTRQGAASTFLSDTLERIYSGLGIDKEKYHRDLAEGFMLSADNAHAMHPNYVSKADPVNRPVIGGGVVLKFSGNQKYCTDGYSAAVVRSVAEKAGCKIQTFTNRSDITGGSTLGNILNNSVPVATADIGLPQFAMHSPFETAGTGDTADMIKLVKTFYELSV